MVEGLSGQAASHRSVLSEHRSEADALESASLERSRLEVIYGENAADWRVLVLRDDELVHQEIPASAADLGRDHGRHPVPAVAATAEAQAEEPEADAAPEPQEDAPAPARRPSRFPRARCRTGCSPSSRSPSPAGASGRTRPSRAGLSAGGGGGAVD